LCVVRWTNESDVESCVLSVQVQSEREREREREGVCVQVEKLDKPEVTYRQITSGQPTKHILSKQKKVTFFERLQAEHL
jgi:hypothetical protein